MKTQKARRYVVRSAKTAAGTMLAAATVAALTAFAPIPAQASPSPTMRVAGVQQDLARAITLGQVTPEQAKRFHDRIAKQIKAD